MEGEPVTEHYILTEADTVNASCTNSLREGGGGGGGRRGTHKEDEENRYWHGNKPHEPHDDEHGTTCIPGLWPSIEEACSIEKPTVKEGGKYLQP